MCEVKGFPYLRDDLPCNQRLIQFCRTLFHEKSSEVERTQIWFKAPHTGWLILSKCLFESPDVGVPSLGWSSGASAY